MLYSQQGSLTARDPNLADTGTATSNQHSPFHTAGTPVWKRPGTGRASDHLQMSTQLPMSRHRVPSLNPQLIITFNCGSWTTRQFWDRDPCLPPFFKASTGMLEMRWCLRLHTPCLHSVEVRLAHRCLFTKEQRWRKSCLLGTLRWWDWRRWPRDVPTTANLGKHHNVC